MANKRKLAKKAKLKKNKDRLVLYHASNNNVESSASESFSGESFDSGYQEIIQEENDGDDDEIDDVESNEPEIDCKVGDKVIAPAITSNSDASYSSSFQGEVIEIEGKKARVQCCLSKQHKLWYNIGSLRRPDRSINDAEELKDVKVKGKRKIAEVVSRKKDEKIKKLQADVRDKAELKRDLKSCRRNCVSLETKNIELGKKVRELINQHSTIRVQSIFSPVREVKHFNSDKEKEIRKRHEELLEDDRRARDIIIEGLNIKVKEGENKIKTMKKKNDSLQIKYSRTLQNLRTAKAEIKQQEKRLEQLTSDYEKLLGEVKDRNLKFDRWEVIRTMLTKVSCRQGKDLLNVSKRKANQWQRLSGFAQKIVNACAIASAARIVELNVDDSSIHGTTVTCMEVVIEKEDGKLKRLFMEASYLPEDKTGESIVQSVKDIFTFHKKWYNIFLEHLAESGVPTEHLPNPSGITLEKMASSCILMSDNAPNAKKGIRLLEDAIRDLVEAGFTKEELDAMDTEARNALCICVSAGCTVHIRNLMANHGAAQQDELLQGVILADPQQRMEHTSDSLLFAVKKLVQPGAYEKGHGHEFKSFVHEKHGNLVLVYLGRAVTGSRFDDSFECAYKVLMMRDEIISFLSFLSMTEKTSHEPSRLTQSVLMRISSTEFKVSLCVLTWFWLKLFRPMRLLSNRAELKMSMMENGEMFDTIEEQLLELIDSPQHMFDFYYEVFEGTIPGRQEWHQKLKKTVNGTTIKWADEVKARAYDCLSESERELANKHVAVIAEGILNELREVGKDYLTSQNGKLCQAALLVQTYGHQLEGVDLHNISVEQTFGLVKSVESRGGWNIHNVGLLCIAVKGKLLEHMPQVFNADQQEALLDFVEKYDCLLQVDLKETKLRQDNMTKTKLQLRQSKYVEKCISSCAESISYYGMPVQIRKVKHTDIKKIVDGLLHGYEKRDFLTNLINFYVKGCGLKDLYRPLTKVKSIDDLFEEAKRVVKDGKGRIPKTCPIDPKLLKTARPETFGLTSSKEYTLRIKQLEDGILDEINRIMNTHEKFTPSFPKVDWGRLERPYFHVPLTPFQMKFERGAKFRFLDELEEIWIAAGISYNTEQRSYQLYYYDSREKAAPESPEKCEWSFFIDTVEKGRTRTGLDNNQTNIEFV